MLARSRVMVSVITELNIGQGYKNKAVARASQLLSSRRKEFSQETQIQKEFVKQSKERTPKRLAWAASK
ncbi:hypothetical protein STEG23_022976, partial [Scotinomys teguina]